MFLTYVDKNNWMFLVNTKIPVWHGSINLNVFTLILSNLQNTNVNLCQTKEVFVNFYYEGLNVTVLFGHWKIQLPHHSMRT